MKLVKNSFICAHRIINMAIIMNCKILKVNLNYTKKQKNKISFEMTHINICNVDD
jgi:hypothetical protein